MTKPRQDESDADLAVLQALGSQGTATIRQLTEAIYPDGGPAYYATVQKLLERLEGKNCIRRERTAGAHVFSAVPAPGDLILRPFPSITEKRSSGSPRPRI